MPDPWTTITEADPALLERLAALLELRGAEPERRAMVAAYLADVDAPAGARLLEVGCGTGAVARQLATWDRAAEVVGVDPSPALIERARSLAGDDARLAFRVADGRALPFPDGSVDVVVFHTVLIHVPAPERFLTEALRVLRPGGWLAAFDLDLPASTFAAGPLDPLQICLAAVMADTHDPWLPRRLPALLGAAGFAVHRARSHGVVTAADPGAQLNVIDLGADLLAAAGGIGADLATALKAEARRRVAAGTWYGHSLFVSFAARRPE